MLRSLASLVVVLFLTTYARSDDWRDHLALATPRQEVGVAALAGRVYVIGGILVDRSATGLVSCYDVAAGQWDEVASLPEDTELHHVGATAVGGRVYAIGGLDGSFRGSRTVFAFDPGAGEWSRAQDLPWRRGSMAVATWDGRVVVAGGQDGSTSFPDAAIYDPKENEWSELPPLGIARNHLVGAVIDDRFYAIGGRARSLFSVVEGLDLSTPAATWLEFAALPTARAGMAASVIGRSIYVFGGEGNRARGDGIFPQLESFDVDRREWTERADMANPRHGIGAATVDDRIYLPGGSPRQGFGVTGVHDSFAPEATFLRGDSNRDGAVEVSDAIRTLRHLFVDGIALPCRDAADSDDSGRLELSDAIFLLNFLFAGGTVPPAPGPVHPGADPTDDQLTCRA
ncbi:MAG: kelch repeat-containing protein [Planctomycetota bacterium]